MPASFAMTLRRLLIVALVLVVLTLLLSIPVLLAPAAAQTPAPTVTPTLPAATATPTDPVTALDDPRPSQIIAVVRENGIVFGLILLSVAVALAALIAVVRKNINTFAERLNVMRSLFGWLDRRRLLGPGIKAYLDWLKREYGRLPQIGIATEQVALDLTRVHVPLRIMERAEIERYHRRMRGENEEKDKLDEWQLFENPDEQLHLHIFTLLSDSQQLEKHIRAKQHEKPRRRWRTHDGSPVIQDTEEPVLPQTTTRLLLLGDAGSGKTTTLRYAALRCAEAYRRGNPRIIAEAGLGLHVTKAPLPIYVRLTHFAATLPTDLNALSLEERQKYTHAPPDLFLQWLDREVQKLCQSPPETLSSQITRPGGNVLLLLDGLDEAGDEQRRAYLAELITNLAAKYRDNRYVVASRTAGYGGRVRLTDFLERHISPLDDKEARAVIEKWFAAVDIRLAETERTSQQENAEVQTAKLWSVIERNPRLFEMATNPLLVTAMALLQFNNVRLPDQRAKLYEKLVELLLDLWRKQQLGNDALLTSVAQLATEQRRIEYLALQMQQQPEQAREVSLRQAHDWLSPLYMQRLNIDREDADTRVKHLLASLSLDSGLIQQRDNGYSFSHYTFQEYLAARALDGMDTRADASDSVPFLIERSADPRWRETLLLAAGHWSNGQQLAKTERLIDDLLKLKTIRADVLAGEALADIGPVEELTTLCIGATTRLRAIAFDPFDKLRAGPVHCPDPRTRNQAAELIDRLGADVRPELDLADERYWTTRIEPGPFVMGPAPEFYSGQGEQEAFTCYIRQPYALARFPVTNRQYAQFLEDLEPAEAAERRPRYWPGQSYRAGEGNHPVVGVTWEDACAFAAWANDRFLTEEQRAKGEQIRLPTEPEWERAAAYPVVLPAGDPGAGKREYPWGALTNTTNDGIKGNIPMNVRETGIGDTSVVGIFPHGAADCGAEELAGNVWEWCSTPYQNYPLPEDLQAESLYTTEEYQDRTFVLRGGSWSFNQSHARCVVRSLTNPLGSPASIGLRLAHLFSSL